MKITLKQKLLVGFGVLTAIILAIGGLSYFSINKMMESDGLVDHTMDVIAHLQILQYNLKKAEASYRSYLILSQPEFLRSTQSSLNLVEKTASEAREMTGDNPKQRDNFGQFMPLLQARLDRGRANIQLCLAGKSGEALGNFKETQSLQASDALDKWIDQMITEEQNLLAKRRDAEDANAHTTLGILVLGACTATFFAFGALLVIRREIGHKEKAQGMLQVNEYRLFQFLEAVPLGIFVLDRDGKPFYANQKARELLGHGIVKSVGTDEMAVLNHAYLAGNDKPYPPEQLPMNRALKGEKSVIEDLEIHLGDGQVIPLQIWGTPVFGMKEEIQYALAIFSDITERRHVEEMKQSLISVVSHQLKTPVGEINGYIENLLDGLAGELSRNQADYLMDMREIGMNNYRLISDLLSLSKIERGLTTANLEKMPLLEIIQLSMRDYENILARKGLTLTLEGLDGIPEVMADRDKMVETLRNLINNAIKFTDKGGLTLSAETRDRVVLLKVKDTGRGISETAMAQLFTQKRVLGEEAGRAGAGLGLYVAKHFMKAQGGDISAITQSGKGSCFTLTIPRAS
jgi:PAS domain S-box-containing protein